LLNTEKKQTGIFYGWWIVVSAFIMSFVYSGFYFWAFTLFVTPMQAEIASVENHIGPAFLIAGILGAILAPILGNIFDKRGPKLVVGFGMIFGGLGFALMGIMQEIWHLYLGLSLAGIGPIAIWAGAIPSVANWFNVFRGRALGLTTAGLGLGGLLTNPSLMFINEFGWRTTFVLIAAAIWIIILPLTMVLRRRPEDYGMFEDGIQGTGDTSEEVEGLFLLQAMKSKVFWGIAAVFSLAFWPIGALQIYQSPFMESVGFTRSVAASTVGIMAIITVIGRIGGGWLADTIDPRKATTLALSLQAFGIIVFAFVSPDQSWLLILFLVAFAPGFGAITVLQPALLAGYFGRRSFAAIQGILWTATSIAFSLAPIALTWIASFFQENLSPGFIIFGIFSVIGAILVVILPKVILLTSQTQEMLE